jgi:alpha-glucosidase (family GH31 glycosyl hydrolase)
MEIGGKGTHAPWDMPTSPAHDAEMIEIYRRYTQLRATLQPYVVAAAAEGATGMPIVRPMPFVDRRDGRLADRWDQYMFGPDLLVAPVWKVGQRSREVYLPRGEWRSYFDRSRTFRGGRTVTLDVPLDAILVFERVGATVPGP